MSSDAVNMENVNRSVAEGTATPQSSQTKPKLKVPKSAPGRTSKVLQNTNKKQRTSTSTSPESSSAREKKYALKKTASKKKKETAKDAEDNWSISSKDLGQEDFDASMDFDEVVGSMPAPPLLTKKSSAKKQPGKLSKYGTASRTNGTTSGETSFVASGNDNTWVSSERTPNNTAAARNKNLKRQGSSNVSFNGSASIEIIGNDSVISPGMLKRRGRAPKVTGDGSNATENGRQSATARQAAQQLPAASPSTMKSSINKRRSIEDAPVLARQSPRPGSRTPSPTMKSSINKRRSVEDAPRQSPRPGSRTPSPRPGIVKDASRRQSGAKSLSPRTGAVKHPPRKSGQFPVGPSLTPTGMARQSVAAAATTTTPQVAAARRSVQNSNSEAGVVMSPMTPGRKSKALNRAPSYNSSPPLTPSQGNASVGGGGPRRISSAPASPGSLNTSLRTGPIREPSLSTTVASSRTPNTPSRRSALGGRRATTGMDEKSLRALELDLDDDDNSNGNKMDKSNVKSTNGSSGPGDAEEVELVKVRKPHPKTDEEWEEFETPPKSLVLVWVVVMGELVFDLGTTVVAFRALGEEDECCGFSIQVGAFPMLITTPFFLLVSSELALLLRAIVLTLWPKMMQPINLDRWDSDVEDNNDDSDNEEEEQGDKKKNTIGEENNIEQNGEFQDEEQAPPGKTDTPNEKKEPFISELTKRRIKRRVVKYFCCWLQWKARILMYILDFLVLLNPFFGCFIAWVLMYQSDKNDAFVVLAFEAGSLALHYIAVWLEGGISNAWDLFLQGLVPLAPFVIAISLVLFYLKQGGVCYLVEDRVFKFTGCEVCVDGYPPIDGICNLKNGTTYTFVPTDFLKLDSYESVEAITARSDQVSYCAKDNPSGPQTKNFCFFDFEQGQLDGLIIGATAAPTFLPTFSSNKCGATVGPGDWERYCQKDLWAPTGDRSMHCFAFGGEGDRCHLNIENDGINYGRFKDPSPCGLEIRDDGHYKSYGDVFYLWDDPSLYGFDARWASNAWQAYSLVRWNNQMFQLRDRGLRVSTPLFTFQTVAQLRDQFDTFFSVCSPHCDDPESNAYIDVLATNVFCNPSAETCRSKASEVSSALQVLAAEFGNRPFHITHWGVVNSRNAAELLDAMDSTSEFFEQGSVVERIYWYSGDQPENSNLKIQARNSRLGLIWQQTCDSINLAV